MLFTERIPVRPVRQVGLHLGEQQRERSTVHPVHRAWPSGKTSEAGEILQTGRSGQQCLQARSHVATQCHRTLDDRSRSFEGDVVSAVPLEHVAFVLSTGRRPLLLHRATAGGECSTRLLHAHAVAALDEYHVHRRQGDDIVTGEQIDRCEHRSVAAQTALQAEVAHALEVTPVRS